MAKNSNYSIYLLGKSMKNYALAMMISIGLLFFAAIILPVWIFGPISPPVDFNSLGLESSLQTLRLSYNGPIGTLGLSIVEWLIVLALGILIVVRYAQFLICLKEAGEVTQEYNLLRAYKMEKYAVIASFGSIFLWFILYRGTTVPIFEGIAYIPYNSLQSGFVGLLRVGLLVLIPLILKILAGSSFVKWAKAMSLQHPENFWLGRILNRVNNIKIGRLITVIPIAYVLGPIVTFYGFWSGGKAIENVYARTEETRRSSQVNHTSQHTSTIHRYHQNDNSAHIESSSGPKTPEHSTDTLTYRPDNKSTHFCSNCGSAITNSEAAFCSFCGKEL